MVTGRGLLYFNHLKATSWKVVETNLLIGWFVARDRLKDHLLGK